ncbi:intraflagellar transport protein 27 homolog isoform X2 [Myripristis murdjan]|uniref:intraflagellar transport protein 27 homolog isoform X2 n=1 Tax=Myripristis murdjan TaxID=586833 RepID=UPI0011761C72|nr:intraflagellar transport protein 27 homolog isoform X2 [Myripristis murdjan]
MVKLRARCLLVGDAAVGKSALSQMFHSDGTLFQKNYSMELYIIDSAGRETFVEACEKMWGRPSLVCLVFDLTSEQSFTSCSHWMERVRAHSEGLHVPGVLVGNKSDLSARREVQASVAQEWAQSQGLEYFETSAKEMENCDAPLLSLARAFHSLYHERLEAIQNLQSPG